MREYEPCAFAQCDVIAGPAAPTTAWKIGEHGDDPENLLADPEAPGSLIRSVRADALEPARAAAQGRMRKKVLAAEEALEAGVEQVVIASSNAASPVTDALAGQGTVFRQAAPRAAARELEA